MAENLLQFCIGDERREDNVGEEALRAVTAPFVLLAADVAALEDRKILRVLRKPLGNLQLVERTQMAVIVVAVAHPIVDVIAEIGLELQRFGILVVNVGARDGRLVRARLIRQSYIANAGDRAQQYRVEGQHCGEGRMSVEVTVRVEFQQFAVDFAMENQDLFLAVEASHAGAVEGRAARVDDERHHLARATEVLQRHNGILAPAYGNNHGISVLRLRVRERRRGGCAHRKDKVQKLQVVGLNAVLVHKLTQPIPVEFAPPPLLVLVQRIWLDEDGRTARALPVADQFDHPDMEDDAFQLLEVEGVPVGRMFPGGQHHLWGKCNPLPYRKTENDVQIAVFHTIIIPFVCKNGIFFS